MEYEEAIKNDKRNWSQIYFAYLIDKNFFFNTFISESFINIRSIKINLFCFRLEVIFVFNALFFTEKYISKAYYNNGKFMEKNEETFKQTFNIDFGDNHQEIQLSSKKSKICKIAVLTVSLVAIITTVTLLVAHFKYGLFSDSETYQVADIKREGNSMEYFSENRKLQTKLTYATGEIAETEQEVDTDFVVMLKEKKGNTITGYLAILDSKAKTKEEEAQLETFDIFDAKTLKEIEANPEGIKIPIAEFTFDENGTLLKINLPKTIDLYTAEKIIELIKDVIPKLSRNKKEDADNGIEIKTRSKGNKKKTFSQYEAPKEFVDRYSKSTFKGSKVSRLIETDIEDEKISEIRANTNLHLETQKNGDEEEQNGFGIDDLKVNVDSKIVATKTETDKTNEIKLVEELVSKMTFADSEEILNALNENKNLEEEKQLRNLASTYYEWALFENIDFLGAKASAYYVIDLSKGKVVNKIKIKAGTYTAWVGNEDGLSQSKSDSNKDSRTDLLLGSFPIVAYEIRIDIKLSLSLSAGVTLLTNKFKVTLSGSVDLKAEVAAGYLIKFTAGVKGKIIGASFTCGFNISPLSFSKSDSKINISSGTITGYLKGEIKGTGKTLVNQELQIWKGWLNKDIPLKY